MCYKHGIQVHMLACVNMYSNFIFNVLQGWDTSSHDSMRECIQQFCIQYVTNTILPLSFIDVPISCAHTTSIKCASSLQSANSLCGLKHLFTFTEYSIKTYIFFVKLRPFTLHPSGHEVQNGLCKLGLSHSEVPLPSLFSLCLRTLAIKGPWFVEEYYAIICKRDLWRKFVG
jgi:hypothetical protein